MGCSQTAENKSEESDKDESDKESSASCNDHVKTIEINYRNAEKAICSICYALMEGKSMKSAKKELLENNIYTKQEINLAIKCIKFEKYKNKHTQKMFNEYKTKYNKNNVDSNKLKTAQTIIKDKLFKEESFLSIRKMLFNNTNDIPFINFALSTITVETYSKYDEIPPIFSEILVYGYIRIQYNKNISTDIISLIFKYIKKTFIMYGIGNYYNIGLGPTPSEDLGNGGSRTINVGLKYVQQLAPKVITSVSAVYYGWNNFLCITNDNTCYAVGRNCFGQLGFDPKLNVYNGSGVGEWTECEYFKENNIKIKLLSGNNVDNICMFYVDINNNIYGCGDNRVGELGIGEKSKECVCKPVLINEYNEAFKDRNSFEIKQIVIGGGKSMILMENGDIYITGRNWYRFIERADRDDSKFEKFDYFNKKRVQIVKIALPDRFDDDCYFLDKNGKLYVYHRRRMKDDDDRQKLQHIIQGDKISFEYPHPEDDDIEFFEPEIPIYECKFFSNIGIKIRDIEAGKEHLIVLDQYFKVWTFGENNHWQCGVETDQEDVLIPVCVSETYNLLPIKRIKGGGDSTILVTFGDNFYVFGLNGYNCLFTKEHHFGFIKEPFYVKNEDILPNHDRIVDVVCNSYTGSTILVAES